MSQTMSRDRLVLASCIVAISALAWAYLIRLDYEMSSMASMGMSTDLEWSPRELILTFTMWSVMMVSMMTPTALPVVLLFTRINAGRQTARSSRVGAAFAAAHISIWIGFSAIAALLQWALHRGVLLSPGMSLINALIAGIVLIVAGIYQLTPAKSKCLTRCQNPVGLLMTHWREGLNGAFQLGLRYGGYCLGCCWALMLILFVVGVMNLAWVAVLTAFILLEKFGTLGARLSQAGGVVIIIAGIVSIAR